jgi:UDP:flavonoid glycosyltransferase YjiC (YdhE family)
VPRSILFACIPLYGHLAPLLRQAKELARRGHDVAVATTEEASHLVDGKLAGVTFVNLGPGGMAIGEAERAVDRVSQEPDFLKGALVIARLLADNWPTLYDAFSSAIARSCPDLMVVDFATTAALDAAEAAGVDFVVNNADLLAVLPIGLLPPASDVPALFSGKLRKDLGAFDRAMAPLARWVGALGMQLTVGRAQNACRRARGLAPVDYGHRLDDRTVLVDSAFGIEYPRPLPPNVHLVGPMLDPDEPALSAPERAWLEEGPPVVFVNFGTVAMPSRQQLQKLAAGLASNRFRALWVLRQEAHERLPDALPPNVRVASWVTSQVNVLAHDNVRAFVSHCGTNSVQESIWAGTPLVGFPMFAAQRDMGLRVVDAGVGVLLDKTRFTPAELRASVERLLDDTSFRRATDPIRRAFEAAGGVRRAADLIEQKACARGRRGVSLA